jgi:pyruvate formate lyase activating enzyme
MIADGHTGICGVRMNQEGVLYALNYGRTIARHVDPIEKKPLYHFLPQTYTYSLATVGCNMHCPWCQNHEISQVKFRGMRLPGVHVTPEDHIKEAQNRGLDSISFTYTEPTIYAEYALDIMSLAKQAGLATIWVTNGYMTDALLADLIPLLDAANVDYKGASQEVYDTYCGGEADVVLQNIKTMHEAGVHVEVTTLIVPGVNDSFEEMRRIATNLASISPDIPWHISRFFPQYRFVHVKTMKVAYRIGQEAGLKHIHLGNV